MTLRLFDALLATLRALETLHEGVATGGSTTTIVDTLLDEQAWGTDDQFNGGTALIVHDAAGAGAAPEAESRAVTDFVAGTQTITVGTAFTAAPAAGDIYGVAPNRFPRSEVVAKIHEALQAFGDLPTVDIASLTTASNDREYALPAAAKRDLREVWLAGSTTEPYLWEKLAGWYVEASAAGAVANLIFPYQPRAPFKLKLVYLAPHPYVQADADQVSDFVDLERLAVEAGRRCGRHRLQGVGASDKQLVNLINDLDARAKELRASRPVYRPPATPRLPFTAERWWQPPTYS